MLMLRPTGQSRESFAKDVNRAVEAFCEKFQDQAVFVAYFRKHWANKTGDNLPYIQLVVLSRCNCIFLHSLEPLNNINIAMAKHNKD